ncbi:5-oxoprolinase subunit PxpB [Pseudalkalibacillus caeni]|uniref:5-oxoprolinase subunit PxpB n=1 Tax=Exobacillus caeni TaxID=2574798 RepID=A0A5R9F151_9BACL|nr:5-oxoprolinase subunit PxpB [Pseudalkalibacillus caeni]
MGDSAIQLFFKEEPSPLLNRTISSICKGLEGKKITGIIESVPSYKALTVFYEPWNLSYDTLKQQLEEMLDQQESKDKLSPSYVVTIPTLYGNEYGPDIALVANKNNLSIEEVITLHTQKDYLIYMMGFMPGFPYLGGLDKKIATPRHENPKARVEAGSVGIAGDQTGIYPFQSPGGWNIIGRTPLKLFQPDNEQPFLYKPGDYLRFKAINEEEFAEIEEAVKQGTYHVKREEMKG